MAVRHRLIKRRPDDVWAVLADGNKYAEWVVGTSESHEMEGRWPQRGAVISYEIRLGPVRLHNKTVVRRCEEGSVLELEAHAGPLGTARIAIELRTWGEHCLVILDEHPLQGAGGRLHNVGFDALIQLRHRAMLSRLARLCEDGGHSEQPAGARAGTATSPNGGRGAAHA
ncbi:SRPBCC family protein [Streptomyces sp. NPDC017941]|uniref:SRPBCC family protein n=1 Tax=unclassified Streptomyces TaxID=2593676 RepID=UPI0037B16813